MHGNLELSPRNERAYTELDFASGKLYANVHNLYKK
jgi:hypothetical protein